MAFPGGSVVKTPPTSAGDSGDAGDAGDAGDVGSVPGLGRSREKEMAIHSSILA